MTARAARKPPRNKVLPVGLSDEELAEIMEESSLSGLTTTQVGRTAILQYVREKKARRKALDTGTLLRVG